METKEKLLGELSALSEEYFDKMLYPDINTSKQYMEGVHDGIQKARALVNKLNTPELVEIPLYIAKWIEAFKKEFDDVWGAMSYIEKFHYGNDTVGFCVFGWYNSNKDDFARAWLNGYTLAKLYTVELSDYAYLKSNGMIVLGTGDDIQPDKLTKSEIMKINPNYWAFRKEVEE